MERIALIIKVLFLSTLPVFSTDDGLKNASNHCMEPLGMEEGKIPDDAITASSSYESKSVGPQNARIRQEKNGGAWCPKAQISSSIREYLEIDLTRDHLITWTETQGRFGNGEGQEFAEAFFLEYWRDEKWHHYKNLKGDQILRGNSNTYISEKQKLDLPFVASRVRFVPYSQHPRTVCMRVEIYGCVWEPGLQSYIIPAGEPLAFGGLNLEDTSYDGIKFNGTLENGLGQLTDSVIGDANELFPTSRGTNWIGWSNRKKIELVFEFKDSQEFANCSLHVANIPRREIEIFSALQAFFSNDGGHYTSWTDKYNVTNDVKTNYALVTVQLQSRTGRFVKLEIHPRAKWTIVSEVKFEIVENLRSKSGSEWEKSGTESSLDHLANAIPEEGPPSKSLDSWNEASNSTRHGRPGTTTSNAFPAGNSPIYIGLASGVFMVVAVFLSCAIYLTKQRGRNKVALLQKHTALLCGPTAPGLTAKDVNKIQPPPLPAVGLVSQSRMMAMIDKSSKNLGEESPRMFLTRSKAKEQQNSEYEPCSVYEGTYKLFAEENLYESANPKTDRFSTYSGLTDFASDHSCQNDKSTEKLVSFTSKRQRQNNSCNKANNHSNHESYYAATDIIMIKRREQQGSSSLFTPLQIQECAQLTSALRFCGIQQISRHRLRILDKLGEGSFGLVYFCEAKGIKSSNATTARNRQIVIFRSLWRGVTDLLKKDFMRDMQLLSGIHDPNLASIIALVEEEPMGAVFEYGELGDLPTFMKTGQPNGLEDVKLGFECLLSFLTQIASGMRYLETLKIAHCDLAARNCILNKSLVVKVSDHAMYCSKYDNEYYVNGYYGKIPLRWMAWEAVLLGETSCCSDVWSFAVTGWEILNCCSELPYAEFTCEQVLENCNKWYQSAPGQASPRTLPQPALCPRELYRLLVTCWHRCALERPTFDEIHQFLKRLSFE